MANEKRLIDANALEQHCKNTKIIELFPEWKDFPYEMKTALIRYGKAWKEIIQNTPTVDAVEVVHSRWVNIVTITDSVCFGFCENCRTEQKAQNATALKAYHKYCRWCGAKMDGGNEDG